MRDALMYWCTAQVITAFIGMVAWVAWLSLKPGSPPPRPDQVPDFIPPWVDDESTVREPRTRG